MHPRNRWTAEHDDYLRKAIAADMSYLRISQATGFSLDTIGIHVHKLGLRSRGKCGCWYGGMVDTLRSLYELGWSSGKIAAEMGITRNQVRGKLDRLGLKGRAPIFSLPTVNKTAYHQQKGRKPKPPEPKAPELRGDRRSAAVRIALRNSTKRQLTKSELRDQLRQAVLNTGGRLDAGGSRP